MADQLCLFDNSDLDVELNDLLLTIVQESNTEEFEFTPHKIKDGYSFRCYRVVWLKIIKKKDKYVIEINNSQKGFYEGVKANIKNAKLVNGKIIIETEYPIENITALKNNLIDRYNFIRNHEPVEYFGCCSHFNECSNEKRCVQADKKLAKGCAYKKNLESGKIFYGVNRNVD